MMVLNPTKDVTDALRLLMGQSGRSDGLNDCLLFASRTFSQRGNWVFNLWKARSRFRSLVFWERMVWIRISRGWFAFRSEGIPYFLSRIWRTFFTFLFSDLSSECCTAVSIQSLCMTRFIFSLSRPLSKSFILSFTFAIKS